MDRIDSINRDRVRWCANERGLSLHDVALEAGVPPHALDRLVNDGVGLTFNQLRALADYFGRGVLFFLEVGPVDEQNAHTVQYRTLTNQKPGLPHGVRKLIERVEHQRELYVALRDELRDDDDQFFKPIDLSGISPSDAAGLARRWLNLSDEKTFDGYRKAVEAKGILVFRSNGYAGRWQISRDSSILGFSLYSEDAPVIFVRKSRWEVQQTFTLMHELGHLLLHRASSIDDDADMHSRFGQERDANAFAGHLLVPSEWLDEIPAVGRGPVDAIDALLAPYRQRWGVSVEVILRRLLDAGRVTQETYAAYRAYVRNLPLAEEEAGSRAYRYREPKHLFGDTFVKTILNALGARRISLTKACSYLDGLKVRDLHSLERHVAGI